MYLKYSFLAGGSRLRSPLSVTEMFDQIKPHCRV